ncbi:PucR family transcriptional regulator [Nocardia sp. NPDC060259]|uniref:PucR family transcriptional regulator n=1 Tax=Nocardia sp. NPDC060259 TaxID=3347088 RepID=UPI003652C06B
MESARIRPAVAELIRRAAAIVSAASAEWIAEIDEAAFSAADIAPFSADPEVRALFLRDIHAHVQHWAAANMRDPGRPVPAFVDDVEMVARSLVFRGHTEASVDAYRLGHNVAWRRWMNIAFDLTTNTDDLRDMLDVTAESMGTFIDETITALAVGIAAEREQLLRGQDAARLEAVSLVIGGGGANVASIERALGYRLDQAHTAVVVWTTDAAPQLSELDRVVNQVARHLRARSVIPAVASAGTIWAWLGEIDTDRLSSIESIVGARPHCQVAVGSTGHGIDGFRTSHLDAVRTQRMMARLDTGRAVATFGDVEGVLLLTASPDLADRFVASTLGPLDNYPELRDTLRVYLIELCNVSNAADRLFTHRNTVLRRIKRANELLPHPLEDNALNIGMALEIRHWRSGPDDRTP